MPELQRLLTQARRISEHRTKEAEGEIRRVYQNLLKDLRAFVAGEYERFAVDDSAPTCRLLNQPYSGNRATTQFYVIDGFIVAPNVEVKAVNVIETDFQYTDHNPVKLEAVLKK